MGPELTTLVIGDRATSWADAGFTVADGPTGPTVRIGAVAIEFAPDGDGRGVLAWRFDGDAGGEIDGIHTLAASPRSADEPVADHPNGVVAVDHVVVMTDDLDRTSAALTARGFEARRRREIPGSEPPRAQIFWWAGATILELVGPATPTGSAPASIWGLALTVDDIDATAAHLGERMGTPRDAVQRGRRIASLRTRDLDISVPIAIMTPHPR